MSQCRYLPPPRPVTEEEVSLSVSHATPRFTMPITVIESRRRLFSRPRDYGTALPMRRPMDWPGDTPHCAIG